MLGEDVVFIYIDSGMDKFVYMVVVVDLQVNCLLILVDDVVEFVLQIEYQLIDKMEIVVCYG